MKQAISGADILVQCLLKHGVDTVFAYPGGASMPIHQALTRVQDKLRTILPRHEQGGGFMAEGYARSTGRVGICIATSGPGATNFVTCLADAKMDSVPIIAITGQVGTHVIGTDAFQETPIVEVSRPITKHHYLVQRTEDIARVMKEAFHVATTGRPGPVIVDIPKDVQNRAVVPEDDPPMNLPGYRPERKATRAQLEQVFHLLRQSKRPIIYAGGGVISANAAHLLKTSRKKPASRSPSRCMAWALSRASITSACKCSVCTARSTPTTPSMKRTSFWRSASASTTA
jgi:acetolactate synthase-1/2/3 large subunit